MCISRATTLLESTYSGTAWSDSQHASELVDPAPTHCMSLNLPTMMIDFNDVPNFFENTSS